MEKLLYRSIDNAPLIVFRIIFGLLIFLESIGAIFTGWVRKTLVEPQFTFNFISFDFLQPFPGHGMYIYYVIMGVFGFLVMIGYRYRLAIISFFVLWTCTYLMQKSSYNNHYYLTVLLAFLMIFLPANAKFSVDARLNPSIKSDVVPYWTSLVFILQISIVYFFGAIAKLYPDWLAATPVTQFLAAKSSYPIIGPLLAKPWFHYFLSYAGIIFDFLIIPLFIFKPTRRIALVLSILFHLFNAIVFQIGIFPFLSLGFAVFFFEPTTIRNLFLRDGKARSANSKGIKKQNVLLVFLSVYFIVQLILPIRHWLINGNVLWTEEGHRMSWRMMLRAKSGYQQFSIVDKKTGNKTSIDLKAYLTQKQISAMATHPDMIWQFAQRLKAIYAQKGKNVAVYVNGTVGVNGRLGQPLIDETVDLADEPWNHFRHHTWLLPFKKDHSIEKR